MLAVILALSAVDYDHLARAVQVEAASNTMDEYCVAVSILNRVKSSKFPNTVADVVYSPGQYEGFRYWNPVAKKSVIARLKDTDKMLKAYSIIGDRTDFKGQSQLRFRVASEDPMCDNKGNFYHHYWQS
jgi:spore germination cell wall hydrolase CwlJ-like protein|tara:strand:+ start:346 stop:732 length:387 start_codon:yes stop_codon:yes gene_type:complete